MTSLQFAEIVELAVKENIIDNDARLMLLARIESKYTPRAAIDEMRSLDEIGNVAWLWFVSRIKEAESEQQQPHGA